MSDASRGPGGTDPSDRDPALSFGPVAEAYERGRPGYPAEAATWLTREAPTVVLELGAGTGKLTRELVALGHGVTATDPDAGMLAVLERELPQVRTLQSAAEALPVPSRSADVVVVAQAFHWFDPDRALPEIARVLRPGGRLSLVWNERDERIPWVRRLGALLGGPTELRDPTEAVAASGLFGPVEHTSFRTWQQVDRENVQDLALSRSAVSTLPPAERDAVLAEVLAFYNDYGRGMDGMLLPQHTRCFRATVVALPQQESPDPQADPRGERGEHDPLHDTMPRGMRARHRAPGAPAGREGDDDDPVLLIDFR